MRIRLYGRLADVLGREVELPSAGCSVGDVRRRLASRHAAAAIELDRSRAVIAGSAVNDYQPVGETDELEFLPPVSGG